MARVRTNNVFGTTTDNPLTNVATTMNSAGLANLAAVSGGDEALITLDPNRVNGAPEIVKVTAHTGSAISAMIQRGQFGTAARQHPLGTEWEHAPVAGPRPAAGTVGDFPQCDPPACSLYNSAAVSCADNASTLITFNTERFDTDTMHSTVSNTSRITIATPGLYLATFNGALTSANDYTRALPILRKNGTTDVAYGTNVESTIAAGPIMQLSRQIKLAAADYLEILIFQDNTANAARNLLASTADGVTDFCVTRIGSGE